MKKFLLILFLVGFSFKSHSQTLIQTFTDRCTGVTQVFQISMTGTTTVVFYDRAKTFTSADVTSGAFQAWLEETYLWWSTLNPCSSAQAEATTAQQTAQQTTSAATTAATNATSSVAPPTNTTTNASPSTTDNPPPTSTSETTSTETSNTTNSSSTDSSSSGDSSSSDTGGSTEGESSEPTESPEDSSSEETKSEDSSSEEPSESEEEVKEEESSESEEESSEEESSEDSESEEEEKKEEKKKNLAPPILASNVMTNQMLDGTWSTAASFGISQSSLTGQETYSANAMIWTNFKQFSLALSKSKIHFWSEYEDMAWVVSPITGKKTPAINFHTGERYVDRQNQIHHVGSVSFNYMNIFGTNVITTGYSHVILGQNDNFWRGFAGGYASTGSLIFLPESFLFSPALTFFGTKPFTFKTLPRWGFAPMIAVSLTPIQLLYQDKKVNVIWNEYFTHILGVNANFKLTQRFIANLGVNTINNTNPIIPTTFAVTIGARFSF